MWRAFNAFREIWNTGSESFHLSPHYILCTHCHWLLALELLVVHGVLFFFIHALVKWVIIHPSDTPGSRCVWKRQWFVSDWIEDQQPRSPTPLLWRPCMKNTTTTKRKNSVSTFLFPMHSLDKSVVELKLKKKRFWHSLILSIIIKNVKNAFKKRKIVFCGWKTFTKSFKVEQWHSGTGKCSVSHKYITKKSLKLKHSAHLIQHSAIK